MCFNYFAIISPWKKSHGSSFEQTWIPFTHGNIVLSLVDIGPVVQAKN